MCGMRVGDVAHNDGMRVAHNDTGAVSDSDDTGLVSDSLVSDSISHGVLCLRSHRVSCLLSHRVLCLRLYITWCVMSPITWCVMSPTLDHIVCHMVCHVSDSISHRVSHGVLCLRLYITSCVTSCVMSRPHRVIYARNTGIIYKNQADTRNTGILAHLDDRLRLSDRTYE